ncbi:MAG: cellulase family glycosylhydrolase [Candidatus Bathyarchaeota archaeon]|nr:cellulase family glycosylhydrolase [Candidatus Bathyarchaeota archaeon]
MSTRWTPEQAWNWYQKQPWLVGCNYTPRTAINQLEMWQKETYAPETIKEELGWAQSLGFNTARVYLHDLVWEKDPAGFKKRIDDFLSITSGYGIRPMFVFFDDCWNTEFKAGKQPDPKPGVHNSGWVQSPGSTRVQDPSTWGILEEYVKDILETFGDDKRVLMWDLYNEPGNNKLDEKSLGLVEAVFRWAREAEPTQPVSIGVWYRNETLNKYQLEHSDIITFHSYQSVEELEQIIAELKQHDRPMICTEYMARTRGSSFQNYMPVFKREEIGCINWGLVSGKTNTIYPWGSPEGGPEPELWFHDIFREEGSPYLVEEAEFIREILDANQ